MLEMIRLSVMEKVATMHKVQERWDGPMHTIEETAMEQLTFVPETCFPALRVRKISERITLEKLNTKVDGLGATADEPMDLVLL
ncbi:hypothetical protein LXL04_009694 [Taraxacum kok-saghyz]